ncbi:MAG: hypothetical protein LBD07_05025 [Spirochaetaceae bacterium]|jgi:hypothetical protein|nr:hypothetical protein [Spirochaetaceae bacterium]
MKRFFVKIIILSIIPATFMILAVFIDPFNVFHYNNIRDTGVEINSNYIKTRYILDNPSKFDSYLFGSSRVGWIDVTAIPELRCYNMTYSEGLPKEHFENLKVFIHNNIIPKTVLIGVDDIAWTVDITRHYNKNLYRKPYPIKAMQNKFACYEFLMDYLNHSIFNSVPIILAHKGDTARYRKQFYENGGAPIYRDLLIYNNPARIKDWEDLAKKYHFWSKGYEPYGIENAIEDILSIINLCKQNNIKLILFTNPLHQLTYKIAEERGYIEFLSRLSEISDYYNFSGINDVTINNDNYFEFSHYRSKVGYLIIDAVFNNKNDNTLLSQGFGYHVCENNRTEFLNILRGAQ